MYEKKHEPLISLKRFIVRILISIALGFTMILIALVLGMWGYYYFEHMTIIDAFANAAMILSGMGPLTPLNTNAGKIFAGCYALFSGLAFIIIMGVILSPVIHRVLHQFHLTEKS